MTFKSLIIFALAASLGRVSAAPFGTKNLDARDSCDGFSCASTDLPRRLAYFDGNNLTLSSSTPGEPTPYLNTPIDPSSTIFSVPPSYTSSSSPPSVFSIDPASVDPLFNPSSTLPADPSSVDPLFNPSSTPLFNPSSSTPPALDPVTITVTSTVFLNPTQSPVPPDSSSSTPEDPSLSLPSSTDPGEVVFLTPSPTPSDPSGVLTLLPSSTLITSPTPTTSPTPSGITFDPPSGN